MDLLAFKWIFVAVFLVLGLVGGFLPLWADKVSKLAVHIAYAFAGGILAAVAMVHMLGDASDDLADLGTDFAGALGGDDYPLAIALFLIGFFLICSVETILHHTLGGHVHYDHSGHEHEAQEKQDNELLAQPAKTKTTNAAGWATIVGLTIHSFFEGVAMGVPKSDFQVSALVIAVAAHKGFAAFANSSVNLPLLNAGRRKLWVAMVLWFALTGPVGMMIGMALTAALPAAGVAIVASLAAGTLLSVGVTEMLLPAFAESRGLAWKLLAAWIGMLAMSLIGVWA